MIKSLCYLVLLSISSTAVFAQKIIERHWGKKYLDVVYAAAPTDDGGYIITGLTSNDIDNDKLGDIFIVKLDSQADTIWTQIFGGTELEGGNSVIQTSDGGFMVSGHTEDFGAVDCDAFLMKLDKNGNHEWFKVYGGEFDDISEQVVQLQDGGYIMAGITASFGNSGLDGNRHIYFIRTDEKGDTLWTKYYAGTGAEYSYSITPMQQGGFLAVGWTTSRGKGEHDAWLLHLDDNGDTLSTKLYPDMGDSRFYQILGTQDKGYLLAGYTTHTNNGRTSGLAVKLDSNGDELWRKTYENNGNSLIFRGVTQLPNGNLIFTGVSYAADTSGNVYIMNTDADGSLLSDGIYGGANSSATCIASQGNNGYLVAGSTAKYGDAYGDAYYMLKDFTSSGIPSAVINLPRIYPNPVKGTASIILPQSEAYQDVTIAVKDMRGQTVWGREHVMGKEIVIDTRGLSGGEYLFNIISKDGKIYKGKFIVE